MLLEADWKEGEGEGEEVWPEVREEARPEAKEEEGKEEEEELDPIDSSGMEAPTLYVMNFLALALVEGRIPVASVRISSGFNITFSFFFRNSTRLSLSDKLEADLEMPFSGGVASLPIVGEAESLFKSPEEPEGFCFCDTFSWGVGAPDPWTPGEEYDCWETESQDP